MVANMDAIITDHLPSKGDGDYRGTFSDLNSQSTGVEIARPEMAAARQKALDLVDNLFNPCHVECTAPGHPAGITNLGEPSSELCEDNAPLNKYAARRRRRAELRDQIANARATGELHSSLTSGSPDEGFCWICARRGLFQFCPQVHSKETNPKIIIEDHLSAAFFAAEAANSAWKPQEERIVFYTDMAAINGTRRDPSIAGAGVTYKRLLADDGSDWDDASFGIIGSNRPDKVELYAIGLALEMAAFEIQAMCKRLYDAEKQEGAEAPTVVIITDSQASLYFIHDFIWKGTIPPLFSPATFTRLMRPMDWLEELRVPINFHWVPSHTSIEGNCRADMLAGIASRWTLEKFPHRLYETLVECEVIRLPSPKHSRQIHTPITTFNEVAPMRESRNSKYKIYGSVAKQIQGMQAEWMSDQAASSYRPNDS